MLDHVFRVVYSKSWLVLFVLVGTASEAAPPLGLAQMPPSPMSPTEADCIAYSQEFLSIMTDLRGRILQCMSQQPVFGRVKTCSGMSLSAYSQCEPINVEKCQFERTGRRAVDQCFAQARTLAANNREELTRLRQAVARLDTAKRTHEKASSIADGLRDPDGFLRKELADYATAKSTVFAVGNSQLDQSLAQEIYQYMHDSIRTGMEMTPNPVVKRIQLEALTHLTRVHQEALQQLDALSAQMKAFDVPTPPDKPQTPIGGGHHPEKHLCELLETC